MRIELTRLDPDAQLPVQQHPPPLERVVAPALRTPAPPLPEITFWEPGGPPMMFPLDPPEISIPRRFGMAAVPAAFVPIRFP